MVVSNNNIDIFKVHDGEQLLIEIFEVCLSRSKIDVKTGKESFALNSSSLWVIYNGVILAFISKNAIVIELKIIVGDSFYTINFHEKSFSKVFIAFLEKLLHHRLHNLEFHYKIEVEVINEKSDFILMGLPNKIFLTEFYQIFMKHESLLKNL